MAKTKIKVRALMLGYYADGRVREGEVFYIYDEADFSPTWMEVLDPKYKALAGEKKAVKKVVKKTLEKVTETIVPEGVRGGLVLGKNLKDQAGDEDEADDNQQSEKTGSDDVI